MWFKTYGSVVSVYDMILLGGNRVSRLCMLTDSEPLGRHTANTRGDRLHGHRLFSRRRIVIIVTEFCRERGYGFNLRIRTSHGTIATV